MEIINREVINDQWDLVICHRPEFSAAPLVITAYDKKADSFLWNSSDETIKNTGIAFTHDVDKNIVINIFLHQIKIFAHLLGSPTHKKKKA